MVEQTEGVEPILVNQKRPFGRILITPSGIEGADQHSLTGAIESGTSRQLETIRALDAVAIDAGF